MSDFLTKSTKTSEKKAYKCVKSTMRDVVKTTKPLTIFSNLKETKLINTDNEDKMIKLLGERVIDALMHVPVNYELWHKVNSFTEIKSGEICCIEAVVDEVKIPNVPQYIARSRRIPSIIKTTTFDSYKLELIFFNFSPFITSYKAGQRIVCQGKLNIDKRGKRSISHPHITTRIQSIHGCVAVYKLNQLENDNVDVSKMQIDNIVPIYSLTEGVKQNQIIALVEKILTNDRFDFSQLDACDYILKDFQQNSKVPSTKESLMRLHFPRSVDDICNNSVFLKKIAFLELLSFQYAISEARAKREHENNGFSISGNGRIREKVLNNLPFSLTEDQNMCLKEIYEDQADSKKMLRLLQGDVGSGKTIVAIMSALNAVECGYKAVIMAPTVILAKQHFATILKLCFGACISTELLTGETKQKIQKDILTRMKLGQIDILVGTHTLFQTKIKLPDNIGLFVIDEQQNFGVEQRLSLIEKCNSADILMMTATPIPRTMIMGLYGDIKVSCIRHKPASRLSVDTRVINFNEKYSDLVEGIKRKIDFGEKIYWICPLVEESEKLDYTDVNTRAKELEKVVDKTKIGVLHGKMSQEKKDQIMNEFKTGNIQLLIATTVVEVGVDVPDASIIVIENAEKFGLSQLHQLHGRVGRGDKQSYCFLLYGDKVSDVGKLRLEALKKNDNGFDIAKLDLKLRGSGTLLDKKQSGFKTTNFIDFSRDEELIIFLHKTDILSIERDRIEQIISIFYKNNEKLINC